MEEREKISQQLFTTMREEHGIGLAANQVGLTQRVFVMDGACERTCFNPEALEVGPDVVAREGCLTFPNLFLDVARPEFAKVRYWDVAGNPVEEELTGIEARCFLHELDHLNGVLITMKVSKLKLDFATRKAKARVRQT